MLRGTSVVGVRLHGTHSEDTPPSPPLSSPPLHPQTALPEDKPRAALSLSTPEDVLQAISLGVDIFGSQYPLTMAERGHAITFSFGELQDAHFPVGCSL